MRHNQVFPVQLKLLTTLLLSLLMISPVMAKKKNKLKATAPLAGEVTFIKGEVTALALSGKAGRKAVPVVKGKSLSEQTSYVTGAQSQLVAQLADGTWLRLAAESKLVIEKQGNDYLLRLETGALRLLYASELTKDRSKRVLVQTENGKIETAEGLVTVTYRPFFHHTNIYVEKGLASVSSLTINQTLTPPIPELVHAGEFSELTTQEEIPRRAKKMEDKEINLLRTLLFDQLKDKEEQSV